jgi:hypothetical protein
MILAYSIKCNISKDKKKLMSGNNLKKDKFSKSNNKKDKKKQINCLIKIIIVNPIGKKCFLCNIEIVNI